MVIDFSCETTLKKRDFWGFEVLVVCNWVLKKNWDFWGSEVLGYGHSNY